MSSSPCTPGLSDYIENSFGILATPCQQSFLITSEANDLVTASGDSMTQEQAQNVATGDVTSTLATFTGNSGQAPNCSSFSDLAQYTTFSSDWFTCLGQIIQSYAIWAVVIIGAILAFYFYLVSRPVR